MEWTQFVIFFLGVFGLFVWNRTESRSDIRHMDSKLEANRELVRAIHDDSRTRFEETKELIRAIHEDSKHMIIAIQSEMKDFHYRLRENEQKKQG